MEKALGAIPLVTPRCRPLKYDVVVFHYRQKESSPSAISDAVGLVTGPFDMIINTRKCDLYL